MSPQKNKKFSLSYNSAFVAVLALLATNLGAEDTKSKEATSPNGLHRAAVEMKGSRRVILIDGEPGPAFDELIWVGGEKFRNFGQMVHREAKDAPMEQSSAPVAFSEDGARYAYVGRQANEFVVILDGKEFARGPFTAWAIQSLGFVPGGNRLCYILKTRPSKDAPEITRLVVEGDPENPPIPNLRASQICFSRDGRHYAYFADLPPENPNGWKHSIHLIVDGKMDPPAYLVPNFSVVAYHEGPLVPLFTGDSKHLITARTQQLSDPKRKGEFTQGPATIFLDQKPLIEAPVTVTKSGSFTQRRAAELTEISAAPEGVNVIAVFKSVDNLYPLFFNQQRVADVHKVNWIAWSPNGKRYAITCGTDHQTVFMIIDGKQRPDYSSIYVLGNKNGSYSYSYGGESRAFTADSSKSVYVGITDKYFLVVEDQESDGFAGIQDVTLSDEGAHISFIGTDAKGNKTKVVVDDKSGP